MLSHLQARSIKKSQDSFNYVVVAYYFFLLNLVQQLWIFAQHNHWCDLNCQRREGSPEHLWVVYACAHEVSPSKAVKSRINWRAHLNSKCFHFCWQILESKMYYR